MKPLARPVPSSELSFHNPFVPAPEVAQWIGRTFLDESGPLANPEHAHLREAHIGVIWTSYPNTRQGRTVLGMAEIPVFRCGAWQKGRQEQQLEEWFGEIPDFLLTFDANYCSQASDIEFCALVEHELRHCAQALTEFGEPRFSRDTGLPIFALRGHDLEIFVEDVRRYGIDAIGPMGRELLEAALAKPVVSGIKISEACGTCASLRRAA